MSRKVNPENMPTYPNIHAAILDVKNRIPTGDWDQESLPIEFTISNEQRAMAAVERADNFTPVRGVIQLPAWLERSAPDVIRWQIAREVAHVLRASNSLTPREWSVADEPALDRLAANWGFPKPSGISEDPSETFFRQLGGILGNEIAATCADFLRNPLIPDRRKYLVLMRYPSGFAYVHRVIADSHKEAIASAVLNDRQKGRFENGAAVSSAGPNIEGEWSVAAEKF